MGTGRALLAETGGPGSPYAAAVGTETPALVRTGVRLAVLGPVGARLDGAEVDLGTPKQRALVSALALGHGHPVSVDSLVDQLWGDDPPPGVTGTLQAYVSGLRRSLEPRRERRTPATVLVTVAPGYALRLPPDATDAGRFDHDVAHAHQVLSVPLLGPSPRTAEEVRAAAARLDDALALWRGTAYAELGDSPGAVAERAHLDELRMIALEDRAVARLALGDHATTAAELEALTATHPLRERLWALRALALVRSGRQAAALDVLREVREVLGDELGLDPGPELRDLQDRVLRQDPALDWTAPRAEAPPGPPLPRRDADPVPAAGAAPEADPAPGATAGHDPARWPLLGRDDELAAAQAALSAAGAGRTSFLALTGDPGIGKSRLCSELTRSAARQGARVLVGRCSQDDGAPPLWPWTTVLDHLGAALPVADGDDVGSQFRSWEAITRTVRDATAAQPVVLVLDDLHWADSATLRVLRLLCETSETDRLLVVVTWRDRPAPTGDLAAVAEALARRHATRLELTGLDEDAVADLVEALTEQQPSAQQADALRSRTDGNPFFLVEYARLAGTAGDLERLLAEDDPPTAVQEVLGRRLATLPAPTLAALRTAAVVGRAFDVATLAGATGDDEEDLLDLVEPAQAAGLVRDDGVDRFVFAHALVRDTIYAALSPSRRARQHARVATHLAGLPDRATEEARHWLAAGPSYGDRAWRAARAAAEVARRSHAHVEAATLCAAAVRAISGDASATLRERYDLLMDLVVSYRWAAMWSELTSAVEEAVTVADRIGDPVLVAEAAMSTTQGALWQSAPHGEVHEPIVAALRRSLLALPPGDSALRCRCMLSLANELYYATTFDERRALVDEALAMARRLDDPRLRMDAAQVAFVTLWTARTAPERLGWAEQALALARETGDEQAGVVSGTLLAVVLGELGRPEEMWRAVEEARAEAVRLRIAYGLLVLDTLVLPWHAMAGDLGTCLTLMTELERTVASASLKHSEDALAGARMTIALWSGHAAEVAVMLETLVDGPLPLETVITTYLWRGGEEERARSWYAEHGPALLETEDWFSLLDWAHGACVALWLADPALGARAYARLAGLDGRSAGAGSGNASGPVDAYLAFAAAAVGETDLARRHGDDAERLARTWQLPLFHRWFVEQRERHGF